LNLSSGIYIYHIRYQTSTGLIRSTIKKLTLLK